MRKNIMYFRKRIPEPRKMEKLELEVFEQETKKNYRRWMVPLVDDALEVTEVSKGKILDVGCGPGLLVKEFARRSNKFQVIGIDVSPYAIKMAKKNCRSLNNVIFKFADVSHLPFENDSFELVICKDSIHHFNNLERAIYEMYRVVKPGSFLYLQDLKRDLPWHLLKMVIPPKNFFQKLQYYSARAAYTKKELSKAINNLVLSNYKIKTRKVTRRVRSKYKEAGIDFDQLRASFQSRYVVVIKKS